MIIQKTVIISLQSKNIKHFQSLGYSIPKYNNGNYRECVKRNSLLEVQVSHLQTNSSTKVLCKCDNCGKEKMVIYQQYNIVLNKIGKYICIKCSHSTTKFKNKCSKISKGKKLSEEHKRKLSENNWQKKHCGKNSPFYNPNLTEEERKRNHSVLGFGKWRRQVKQRDNYICQCCGYVGKPHDGIMVAHHINNFSDFKEQRILVENGITFCQKCHIKFHQKYGSKPNEINLIEFLK